MHIIVFDVYYGTDFSESLLGFGVSSGIFKDLAPATTAPTPLPAVTLAPAPSPAPTANLRIKILDFRGFDSGRILILRGGILMSIMIFPEITSQAILVGTILVGRLGVQS